VGEHPNGQLAYLRLGSASGVLGRPAISALLEVEMVRQENTRYFIATERSLDRTAKSKQFAEAVAKAALIEPTSEPGAAPRSMTDL
jgi:hypothetical protein